ncbi:biotin-dependent carboxyltransferase family protein [Nocardioides sp. LHG3406-4]|uniref:5-oxoprolinase subunit C family protein n=1 Tax=Nocardioides sp. LHG3406-4 TaxID=2804575 RepID=UPI003CE85BA4
MSAAAPRVATLTITTPGMRALVQDAGRDGWAYLGVGRSGAADRPAMELANRLVGNEEHAAVIEVTNGGLELRFDASTWFAVTGAPLLVRVGTRARWTHEAIPVSADEAVRLEMPARGLRSYLAVRGGLLVEPVLGSRSTDLLSGLGPAPLAPGDVLTLGPPVGPVPAVDVVAPVLPAAADEDVFLPVRLGPRADWFEPGAVDLLLAERFEVTADSNRIGVRLGGPTLPRRNDDELASEGVVEGSVQAPPDGRLTLFGPDHPVTGGYPVIAVVDSRALSLVAQLRPGQGVRFRTN